jgi:hypothetical protein
MGKAERTRKRKGKDVGKSGTDKQPAKKQSENPNISKRNTSDKSKNQGEETVVAKVFAKDSSGNEQGNVINDLPTDATTKSTKHVVTDGDSLGIIQPSVPTDASITLTEKGKNISNNDDSIDSLHSADESFVDRYFYDPPFSVFE